MTFEEAKIFLSKCRREELRDHAFGDREIYWTVNGKEVAYGYIGGRCADVSVDNDNHFSDNQALALAECGSEVSIERNDETGPDQYEDGKVMPGLTLEGVRRELCGED